jgi:thiol-disulfide isomerase/thioredoxin
MRLSTSVAWTLFLLFAPLVVASADETPAETLAAIKNEHKAASAEYAKSAKGATAEADRRAVSHRYTKQIAELGKRAIALAQAHPRDPEAVEALVWARSSPGRNDPALYDRIYDMLAEHHLDSDALVQVCAYAWLDTTRSTRAEPFLLAAFERSKNINVRARACLSLGLYQKELAHLARNLNDPVRGEIQSKNLERTGADVVPQLRSLDPVKLEQAAARYFETTIKEYAHLRPSGAKTPELGERAAGELFQMQHLSIGCKTPQIEGEDIDGKPMKLSDFRGKVVLISFWATWCGPCMRLVPDEKALVEKMKGRPFVLLGVNGDENREQAKKISMKEGIPWRSFWNGGPGRGIALEWGVLGWPTIYVLDANGVIRDDGLVYHHELRATGTHDKMIENLVAEAESAAKR